MEDHHQQLCKKKIILDKYEVERLLGKGAFATVYQAKRLPSTAPKHEGDGDGNIVKAATAEAGHQQEQQEDETTTTSVAIKVIDKRDMEKAGMVEQIKREISVMKKVKHPNIVEIKEVMATKTKIYIVMEYLAGGELSDKLIRMRRLPENDARRYFQQLISAVEFCHSRGVYHRDLKLENLLLDASHSTVKVADFGLSASSPDQIRGDGLLHTVCGALSYMSPELLQDRGYDGAKADIWSCGVILFALLSGTLPFQDESVRRMCAKIMSEGGYDFPPRFPPGARRLVAKMLVVDPARRIPIEAIKRDPWLYRGVNRSISTANLADLDRDGHHGHCSSSSLLGGFNRKPLVRGRLGKQNSSAGELSLRTSSSSPSFYNAFELISSMASGFDLSNLFEEDRKKAPSTVFTSRRSEAEIVEAIERMGRSSKRFDVERVKDEYKVKLVAVDRDGDFGFDGYDAEGEGEWERRKLAVTAEVFRAAPEVAVVEFTKDSGDEAEFARFCEEEARPGLADVVWTWKGDQRRHHQDDQPNRNSSAASSDTNYTTDIDADETWS